MFQEQMYKIKELTLLSIYDMEKGVEMPFFKTAPSTVQPALQGRCFQANDMKERKVFEKVLV